MTKQELLDHRLNIIKNLYIQLEKISKKKELYSKMKGIKHD